MKQLPIHQLMRLVRGRNTGSGLILLALILLALWFQPGDPDALIAGTYPGSVTHVIDGDTLDLRDEQGVTHRIRLLGIDTMEVHEEDKRLEQARRLDLTPDEVRRLGQQASDRMRRLAHRQDVTWIIPDGTPVRDRYDRVLAYVELDGEDLGERLLAEGLAELRRDRHPRASRYRAAARPLTKQAGMPGK